MTLNGIEIKCLRESLGLNLKQASELLDLPMQSLMDLEVSREQAPEDLVDTYAELEGDLVEIAQAIVEAVSQSTDKTAGIVVFDSDELMQKYCSELFEAMPSASIYRQAAWSALLELNEDEDFDASLIAFDETSYLEWLESKGCEHSVEELTLWGVAQKVDYLQ